MELQVFNYQDNEVRTVELNGEPEMTLEYGGLEFTVLEVEDRRVGKVKCTRAPELNPENDDDEEEDA